MFGGFLGSSETDETWEWNGTTWTEVTPAVSPPPREGPVMTFDVRRGVAVMFGGYSATDLWEWDGTTWMQRNPSLAPPARGVAGMAYHAGRGTTILFGGYEDDYLGDLWEWDGTTWVEFAVADAPAARYGHVFAYDEARASFVVFSAPGLCERIASARARRDGGERLRAFVCICDRLRAT